MQSLAVKYRPKTFSDVVGQENILTILKNQIGGNGIKQGYLFTGGAGTGKTTTARIFATEINKGKGNPIEIDAASNNGVENIREIRESCKFKSLDSDYKVYIIDEVHQLSIGAFNALLKILEEPPKHVVFILCTTDPQKIPPTILSRIQRFDFKRMTVEQLVNRLNHIVTSENNCEVSYEAMEYISKLANGGMRNAISLLDTCLSYKHQLTMKDIPEILGTSDYSSFVELLSVVDTDKTKVIEIIETLHINGKDLKTFLLGFLEFIVEVRKVQLLNNFNYVSIPSTYQEQVKGLTSKDLQMYFTKLNNLYHNIKYETNPKVLIEGELLCL